jgi:hypothetical protein
MLDKDIRLKEASAKPPPYGLLLLVKLDGLLTDFLNIFRLG